MRNNNIIIKLYCDLSLNLLVNNILINNERLKSFVITQNYDFDNILS